jgi:hypothetical protein
MPLTPWFGSSSRALDRSSRPPGMGFGHELLVAMMMAIALLATVLLYR